MDPDLPLIEIAGADDSLLQPTPHGAATDDAYFFCSPLHPPRSRLKESVKVSGDSMNKEISNVNKIEEKKFSLHPQQMKRKKKGGYNLRKSLAWDRAFFEEEGVLNSEELSMITRGSLSVISEESGCDSAYLQDLEENIFKVNPGSTPKKDRITGGSALSKHASPARDNAVPGSAGWQKVLSVRDSNRSGSKRSGCPRPMASSSLKRPANVNTLKSATKEPKISKIPVPKPVPCALSTTSKNVTVGPNDLKRSQIACPTVNLNNTKNGLNNAKVGPTGKSLTGKSCTRPTRRNAANLVKSSPTKVQCPPVTEAKDRLEVIPKQALPSTRHTSYGRDELYRKNAVPEEITSKQTGSSASHASYYRDDRLRKVAVPLSHTGVNLPHTQLRTSKPSGLRMPSPSLSFFNQQKASSLPGPHKSSSQPCKIPNLRHIGSVNPVPNSRLPSSGKISNVTNAGTVKGNTNVQCSSSSSVPSAISPVALCKVDSVSQIRHQAELKVPIKSKGYGMTEDHRKLKSAPVHGYQQSTPQAEPNITENLFYMEDVESQSSDDKYLVDQGPSLAFPRKQTEIEGHSFEKVADPEVQNGSAGEYKTVEGFSYSRCEDQAKDDSSTLKTMSRNVHVEEAQMLASDGKTDGVNDVKLSSSALDNWQLVKVDNRSEKPEGQDLSNPCYIEEQVYQDDCVLDCFDVLPRVESKEPQGNGSGKIESTTSRNIYVTPPVMLDCMSNEVAMVDSLNVENIALVSEDNRAVVEKNNLDTHFMDDICMPRQACLELHNMDEDQRRVSLIAHNIKVTSSKCGDLTSQLNLTMQVEASAKDTIEHRCLGFKGSDLSVESSCHARQLQPEDDINSCHQDTSLMAQTKFMGDKINVIEEEADVPSDEFDDGKHNVQHAEQVMSCSGAEARILNWNPGDYGLQSEGSKSVEVCHKYITKKSEDICLKVNWCDASGLQSPPDLSKHKILEEANNEVDDGNDVIKQPLPGSSEDQSSVPNCRRSELRHPNVVAVQVSQEIKPRSGILLANNGSCEEHEETDELVLHRNDASTKCSSACKEVASAIPDGRPDLGGKVDYSQKELAVTRSSMVEQSAENANDYTKSSDTNRPCDQAASVESYSSAQIIKEEDSVRTLTCTSLEGKLRSSLISDQTSSSGSVMQDNEVNVMSSHTMAEDAEISILESNHTLGDELQQESDGTMYPPEEKNARKELKKSRSGKQDGLVIIPPSDAVPFSDEWLAAVEAAGEEILTKKGGAVQNSPPNKSPPRLGPYSPVKRKQNQVIGPFDCTKHTNLPGSQ